MLITLMTVGLCAYFGICLIALIWHWVKPKAGRARRSGSEAASTPRPRPANANKAPRAAGDRPAQQRQNRGPKWRATMDGATIIIDYRDANEVDTRREIRPIHIEWTTKADGTTKIADLYAYCLLRKQPRQFKGQRILHAYDPDTGEVVSDVAAYLFNLRTEAGNIIDGTEPARAAG